MMNRKLAPSLTLALLVLALGAPTLEAQLKQYRPAGQLTDAETPDREEMKRRIEEAAWTWGRARVQPRLGLGQVEYRNNVFDESDSAEQTSDLRASAHAGLEIFLPVGTDSVLVTFARPSYQWWQDTDALNRLNWNYGVAAFGYFNRASAQISARRTEVEQNLNNEVRIPVTTQTDRIGVDGEIEIRGPWKVFGSVVSAGSRYPNAEDLVDYISELTLLERDEEIFSLGVAYDAAGRFEAGLGWRQVETDFLDDPEGRSSSGDYPFLKLSVPGNQLQMTAEVGQRLLEFADSSGLRETEETVGTVRLTVPLGDRTDFALYGSRDIVYSVLDASAFFAGDVTGVSLSWGRELKVSLFAQSGDDEYTSAGGFNEGRLDSGESFGASITFPLRWGLATQLGYHDTTIDSNFDEFDRTGSSLGLSVKLDLPDFPF